MYRRAVLYNGDLHEQKPRRRDCVVGVYIMHYKN